MLTKVQMFLQARDRAWARKDYGIVRATTADLRRLGVPDDATLANPAGGKVTAVAEAPAEAPRRGRPAKARCEHGAIAERCEECRLAEIEEARGTAA